ncbi:MAG TPA: hypothetical protein VGP73_08350 [Thermoanaerobaculia bacterium]
MASRKTDALGSAGIVTNLSDAIFGPVNRAYRVGGFGLAFLGIGVLLMLAVFLSDKTDWRAIGLFIVGVVLVIATGVLFLLRDVLPLLVVRNRIEQNREFIDIVQRTAVDLTELLDLAQELAIQNAEGISSILEKLRPVVRMLPAIGHVADSKPVVRTEETARSIVVIAKNGRAVIGDVREALVHSNPDPLKAYVSKLEELSHLIKEVLDRRVADEDSPNP